MKSRFIEHMDLESISIPVDSPLLATCASSPKPSSTAPATSASRHTPRSLSISPSIANLFAYSNKSPTRVAASFSGPSPRSRPTPSHAAASLANRQSVISTDSSSSSSEKASSEDSSAQRVPSGSSTGSSNSGVSEDEEATSPIRKALRRMSVGVKRRL